MADNSPVCAALKLHDQNQWLGFGGEGDAGVA